jgi:hypothetical protein
VFGVIIFYDYWKLVRPLLAHMLVVYIFGPAIIR